MTAFDYVIIGAGSAGCVLADRLSRDPDATVLVLEAGGEDDNPDIHHPGSWLNLLGSEADWGYQTEPQSRAAGQTVYWPRGRVLGGSSSINALVHMRGAAGDYDNWAASSPGWGYSSVLPAFKAIEDFDGGDAGYHGQGGPLRLELPEQVSPFAEDVHAAALALGHAANDDFNGRSIDGVGWNQMAMRDGRRQSAAVAFLRPALRRPNVTLVTRSRATRLVLAGGRVTAVEYLHDGQTHRVPVEREALLCAGTIESPKLLMLSGIGPAQHLRQWGVVVEVDAPGVGANLHDHPGISVTFSARRDVPVGLHQGSELGLFARADPASPVPQIQFGILSVTVPPAGLPAPERGFTFAPSWTRPASRGQLRLRSASPLDPPRCDPGYLTEQADVDGLVAAIEVARELAGAGELAAWRDTEVHPGNDVRTDAELRAYVRHNVTTWFHPVGTCRMGIDDLAVVDPELRVHGVANLRVVDASVIPTVPTGNTNAPTLMIAWRAADLMGAP